MHGKCLQSLFLAASSPWVPSRCCLLAFSHQSHSFNILPVLLVAHLQGGCLLLCVRAYSLFFGLLNPFPVPPHSSSSWSHISVDFWHFSLTPSPARELEEKSIEISPSKEEMEGSDKKDENQKMGESLGNVTSQLKSLSSNFL